MFNICKFKYINQSIKIKKMCMRFELMKKGFADLRINHSTNTSKKYK